MMDNLEMKFRNEMERRGFGGMGSRVVFGVCPMPKKDGEKESKRETKKETDR